MQLRSTVKVLAVIAVWPVIAEGQTPPGYRYVRITNGPEFEYWPRINNKGDVVFTRRPGFSEHTEDIYLYSKGKLTRLTFDDDIRDTFPDINDDGVIVWSRGVGPEGPYGPTLEVMVRTPDGTVTRLTDDANSDHLPRINKLGHVVWSAEMFDYCGSTDVFYYDGASVQQLTTDSEHCNGVWNQGAAINDRDQIVFTRYDFDADPWVSSIVLYKNDVHQRISPDETFEPQHPSINNRGAVVWTYNAPDMDGGLQAWENDVVTDLTHWGSSPEIGDRGQIVFTRWDDKRRVLDLWSFHNGVFTLLVQVDEDQDVPDINRRGEITWASGDLFETDIGLLRRVRTLQGRRR